jgi:hypothetical protein
MTANKTKWVRLGDYIERSMANNKDLTYGVDLIQGVNSDGTFSSSKANTIDINLKPYKIVLNGDFVYNPSRLNIGSIAYRQEGLCIVSHLYVVFRLNERGRQCIIPEFLYLYFRRDEFFRQITFLNFGSQRPEFNFFEMSDIRIPLPSMEVQRELVATYEGLKRVAEDNEALIAPLTEACQAFIVDCKRQYPSVPLGDYIEEVDERNTDLSVSLSQGIANTKVFQEPKQVSSNSKSDKIVRTGQFAYNRATTRNGEKISIAYRIGADCTVSSAYCVFKVTKEDLLNPYFLWMFFSRSEFDRYARYLSKGSAHEFFEWEEMCRVQIPLPPLEVQQSIVNLYHCIEEAKSIAREARERLTTLCPALVQYAINA